MNSALHQHNVEALLDAIEDSVLLLDTEGRIVLANLAGARQLGHTREGMAGRTLLQLGMKPASAAVWLQWMGRVAALGKPAYFEDESGPCVHDIAMFPVVEPEGGKVARVAVVVRDITQARRDQADLEAARRDREHMAIRLRTLEKRLEGRGVRGDMIGTSPAMDEVFARMDQAAGVDCAVLVRGEAGTGKEMVAGVIHASGMRKNGPLEHVDCKGADQDHLESELFGHVRGAFPGAGRARRGRVEAAGGGVLYLSCIESLPSRLQNKLLRLMERGEFEPMGAEAPTASDVRVVASTEADLSELVRRGRFREDLFYLLRAMDIHLPPLRERAEDIGPLAEHFLAHYGTVFRKRLESVSREAMQAMLTHQWPGNVRELRHAMEHATLRCAGEEILSIHLPPEVVSGPRSGDTGRRAGREAVLRALTACRWNKTRAARLLGISRGTLYSRMKAFDLQRDEE